MIPTWVFIATFPIARPHLDDLAQCRSITRNRVLNGRNFANWVRERVHLCGMLSTSTYVKNYHYMIIFTSSSTFDFAAEWPCAAINCSAGRCPNFCRTMPQTCWGSPNCAPADPHHPVLIVIINRSRSRRDLQAVEIVDLAPFLEFIDEGNRTKPVSAILDCNPPWLAFVVVIAGRAFFLEFGVL